MAEKIIDLNKERLIFISYHTKNGKGVHTLLFENTVIYLNDEQMERLRN